MIVDAHAHVFAAASERFPRAVHELYPAEMEVPVADLLAAMDRNGVSRAVLVALSPHDEYLAHCLEAHPGRFAAVGIWDPSSFSLEIYRRRRDTVPLQGLRFFDLGDAAIDEVTDLAVFSLLEQMEADGTKLWFYSGQDQLALLDRVLERLPALTVVLNHLGFSPGTLRIDEHGRPRFDEQLPPRHLALTCSLARHAGVHVLFSGHYAFSDVGYPYADLDGVVAALLDAYGPERLLFGSDFPWIRSEPGYAETVALVARQLGGLSADQRAAVLGTNAAAMFGFR
ncbi:MAG TPA: amidohydrolase family protein [Acidimicrobiales bacterium]|nr:amidohydrolase family protein [Acidimicrobiales bacterium]